ncbi:hypothetical protein C8R45DRAFT_197569 [Mycena sanguinolenta]|nr:hypothetical protein C8R45DRAFT_197569 [Mycena sanguinolenta]
MNGLREREAMRGHEVSCIRFELDRRGGGYDALPEGKRARCRVFVGPEGADEAMRNVVPSQYQGLAAPAPIACDSSGNIAVDLLRGNCSAELVSHLLSELLIPAPAPASSSPFDIGLTSFPALIRKAARTASSSSLTATSAGHRFSMHAGRRIDVQRLPAGLRPECGAGGERGAVADVERHSTNVCSEDPAVPHCERPPLEI